MAQEKRVSSIATELRAAAGRKISGYAAKYGMLSRELSGGTRGQSFRERINRGAFKHVGGQDVRCLVNHDASQILGRTAAGTLEVRDDGIGLAFECTMPDTQLGRDTYESIKRGDISQCSFAFTLGPGDDSFDQENGIVVRTLNNISQVHDISVVTYPAYENGTSVSARSLDYVSKRAQAYVQRITTPAYANAEELRAGRPEGTYRILSDKCWQEVTPVVAAIHRLETELDEDVQRRRRDLLNQILS